MTGENKDEEIKLTPAEDNRWWDLLEQTKGLDYQLAKPRGWHWFWGLDYLYNNPKNLKDLPFFDTETIQNLPFFDVKTIQKKLPDGHWLKKLNSTELKNVYDNEEHRILVETLKEIFKQGEKIVSLIDFSKLRFDNSADFSNLIFPFAVSFEHTEFSNGVLFHGTIFCRQGNFSKTQFSGESNVSVKIAFNDAMFFGLANFDNAKFINGVSFNGVSFLTNAHFQNTRFFEMVNFTNAKLPEIANFRDATFSSLANFRAANILGIAIFIGAHFETRTPYFHDAKIGTGILWDTNINLWPQTKKDADNETTDNYNYRMISNRNNYENLTSHMQKLNKKDDQHFFFRQEMRWRQELAESPTSGFAFRIYDVFSGYGYNIGRAFWWWVGHIALGVIVIAFIAMCGGMRFHESLPCAIPVSFANANPYVFFGFESSSLKECYKILEPLAPISFAIVKAIQTAIGIALLSLLIITLRVRFRLK